MIEGIGFAGYGEPLTLDEETEGYWLEINFVEPIRLEYEEIAYKEVCSVVVSLEESSLYLFTGERKKEM